MQRLTRRRTSNALTVKVTDIANRNALNPRSADFVTQLNTSKQTAPGTATVTAVAAQEAVIRTPTPGVAVTVVAAVDEVADEAADEAAVAAVVEDLHRAPPRHHCQ
eukprot:tig00020903_g15133.t1